MIHVKAPGERPTDPVTRNFTDSVRRDYE